MEDQDLETMAALLKDTEWDFPPLSDKEVKKLENGAMPQTLKDLMESALQANIMK